MRVQEATPAEEPPAEEAAAETPAAGDSGQEAPPADEAAADKDAAPKPDGEQALDVDTEDTGAPAEPGQGEAAAEDHTVHRPVRDVVVAFCCADPAGEPTIRKSQV